jgi:flagellar biosynthesis/type III secretory pathway M-ring protein FliF/YscJ
MMATVVVLAGCAVMIVVYAVVLVVDARQPTKETLLSAPENKP